MTLRLGLMRTR